jgi:hypothetical protein
MREAVLLARRLATPQRTVLLYYLRFGLLERAQRMARQRLRSSRFSIRPRLSNAKSKGQTCRAT